MSVDVKLTVLDGSKITPSLESEFLLVKGLTSLAQRVTKLFLTELGSDYFNRDSGSNLLKLYGTYNKQQIKQMKPLFSTVVKNLEESIKETQQDDELNGITYSDSEQLEQLLLESIEYDELSTGWSLKIRVINKVGENAYIQIP